MDEAQMDEALKHDALVSPEQRLRLLEMQAVVTNTAAHKVAEALPDVIDALIKAARSGDVQAAMYIADLALARAE
jgi:hypothetical protein